MVRLNEVRSPFYAEVADLVIDVDDLSPEAVAARIIELVPRDADKNAPSDAASDAATGTAPAKAE